MIPPPEAANIKLRRLLDARGAILSALEQGRTLPLVRASEIAESHGVRLEDILMRLEECSVDWERGVLKCD